MSIKESCQEGLDALKDFLMDLPISSYPPKQILTCDLTSTNEQASLDMYLLDDDIQTIMKMPFKEEEFTKEFASKYPEVTNMCWKSNNYSEFAKSLGFGK